MTDLIALAERVEKATGPDEGLDVEIVYALHPDIGPYQGMCIGDEPIFWHDPYRKQPCPAFTSSLDAAMSLVPEGFTVINQSTTVSGCWATIMFGHGNEGRSYRCATPALALTAACLRAHAQQGEG